MAHFAAHAIVGLLVFLFILLPAITLEALVHFVPIWLPWVTPFMLTAFEYFAHVVSVIDIFLGVVYFVRVFVRAVREGFS